MNAEQLLLAIQELLDGVEWSPDTLDAIAQLMRDNGYKIRDLDDQDPDRKCSQCGAQLPERMHRGCGAYVCEECGNHQGLVRCYCGWSADGGDGRAQLQEMGENLDDDY